MKKRILSILLSLCMVLTLAPQAAFAGTGTDSTPSVTAYATKDQLMDGTFAPNSNVTASNIGKLVFGKNSSGQPQEWYILDKDDGVAGDNTVIFAASPMVTGQIFSPYSPHDAIDVPSDSNAKYVKNITIQPYLDITYIGINNTEISKVYINHYGTSDLRMALRLIAGSTNHFTEAEQVLMNATTVTTTDMRQKSLGNDLSYTTTDKLYAPASDDFDESVKTIKAGSGDQKTLADSYWSGADAFWLRSPNPTKTSEGSSGKGFWHQALFVGKFYETETGEKVYGGDYVISQAVTKKFGVRPASNIDLSSVSFASAAIAASSGVATSGTIEQGKAMTLRLDGSSKNIGTVTYSTATGDIKATKGSTTGDVALVVQGNDGAKDWYYSKKIDTSESINASDIKSTLNLSSDIDLSACKIWLETTEDNVAYAVSAKEAKAISSVGITGINTPEAGVALDTEATCETTGVSSTKPQVTWTPAHTNAGYNTSYTASVTLTAGTGYEFANSTAATINGKSAKSVKKNQDGTLTVTYLFDTTAKDKLISITPQSITVANGTAYDAMNLPATVGIVTEGNTVTSASVTWDTTTPASGSYDPDVLTEQTVTLNGTVTCPDNIDDNGVTLTTTITITISAAGIVGAPTASPASGTYTENQSVTLTSSTEGAEIYYTTDGSEPKRTNGTKYTGAIPVTANPGQSITTTIRAIAVKDKMQDSGIATFTYTITAKDKLTSITAPQAITVANGTAYDAMNLPATVGIVTEGNTVTSASVTWDTTTPASGSYDPDVLTEQTVTLNGTVTCPDNIDDNGVTLTTTITITISAAGIVGAPTASPASGTYTENQSVTLTSSTEGAEIYYTTDGSEPKRTNGTKYTGAIPVTANPGQSITTAIRAIAVKDKMQDSGIATFTYTITAKDKLTSITAPQAITAANGTAYDAMKLPATVGIVTEGNTVTSASVTWDTTTPASGSYDPDVLTEQTVTLNGTVTCPDNIDDNGVTLTTTITITISAAGIVGAPTASPASGTYTENQSVTLTSSTEGGEIYYTIDGTSPSCTNGTKYTEAISVTGTEGKSVQTTIKAIAVKNGMQNSDVVTFTYTIKIPAQQNTGGGGGGYVPPVQKPIVKNDDNATTSADLSDTTSASGDTTTANIDKTIGDEIVDKAVANESKDIVIDATAKNTTAADSTTTTQVGIPTNTLGAIAEKTEADVTVKTDVAEIKMDNAAAGAIAEQAAGDTVQIILEKVDEKKNKVEFQLKVVCSDGNVISDFKGGNVAVTVTVPKDMAEKKVVCVFIDDNGRISKVKGQKNADGTYTFFTGHFSTYALMTEEEADTAIAEQKEEIHAKLDSYELVARSMACKSPSGKKAIRIRVYDKNGLSTDFFDGIEIYRSTKKNTGYGKKPIFVIKSGKSSYYNTAIKSGTKYYYRVRGFVIIDGQKYYTDYSLKAIRTAK